MLALPEHHASEAAEIRQYSFWAIVIITIFSLSFISAGLIFSIPALTFVGVVSAVSSFFFILGWHKARNGAIPVAIGMLSLGLWLMALGATVADPPLLPVAILLPTIVVLLGLPYLNSRFLLRLMVISWIATLTLFIAGEFVVIFPLPPQTLNRVFILLSGPIGLVRMYRVIWYYHGNLNKVIDALRQANDTLEQRVQERTAALQVALKTAEEARREADEANELKSKFLANMSHELRTPLNAVINYAELTRMDLDDLGLFRLEPSDIAVLQELAQSRTTSPKGSNGLAEEEFDEDDPRQQRLYLDRIIYNGQHLLSLINDVLDLSKLNAGLLEINFEEAQLAPICESIRSTGLGLTKGKRLAIVVDVPSSLPRVYVDTTRVHQVLLNLVSNAAKFTNEGLITLAARARADGFVEVMVRDTGIGIAPEHQAMVFQEFHQVQSDLQRKYQGTGLGLPISKHLIELQGGTMWLESSLGRGSAFFFTLPIAGLRDAPSPPAVLPSATGEGAAINPIVVIDDNPDTHRILKAHLASLRYPVVSVLDSLQAVSILQRYVANQQKPLLVILDIMMPFRSGWEVLEEIRGTSELADIPVIFYTIVDKPRSELTQVLKVDGYLLKPIERELLISTVREVIGRGHEQKPLALVIDDQEDARRVIRRYLEAEGILVREAASGVEGLALAAELRPQLVILDLMMPQMDGFEVLSRLRAEQDSETLPVLIVSAKELTPAERDRLIAQSQAFIEKDPLVPEDFIGYVKSILT